jgi:hypothetical protein
VPIQDRSLAHARGSVSARRPSGSGLPHGNKIKRSKTWQVAEKGQRPIADARGSETHLRVCNEVPSRAREGAVAATTFSASC